MGGPMGGPIIIAWPWLMLRGVQKGPLGRNSTSVFRCSACHCLSLTLQLLLQGCGWVGTVLENNCLQTGLSRPNDAAL